MTLLSTRTLACVYTLVKMQQIVYLNILIAIYGELHLASSSFLHFSKLYAQHAHSLAFRQTRNRFPLT